MLKELIDKGFIESRAGHGRPAPAAALRHRRRATSWRWSSPGCRPRASRGRLPRSAPAAKAAVSRFLLAHDRPGRPRPGRAPRVRRPRKPDTSDRRHDASPADASTFPTTRRTCSWSTTTAACATSWRASSPSTAIGSPRRRAPPRRGAKRESLVFDALVLDVMMPGENGFDYARSLRADVAGADPMLTAPRRRRPTASTGLEIGADDYLPKPFEPRELLLRLGNILKRAHAAAPRRRRSRAGSRPLRPLHLPLRPRRVAARRRDRSASPSASARS